jgi:hypothetical protein
MEASHVGIIATAVIAWSTLLLAVIKILLDRYLTAVTAQIAELQLENKDLKKDIARIREELPLLYVRQEQCKSCREEWMRIVGVIDQKLAAFAERVIGKFEDLRKELYEQRSR